MKGNKAKKNWVEDLTEKIRPIPPAQEVLITIIIPTFNCSERIGDTLTSIKRQHYQQVEVIIVDAGSTDHTLEIVSSFGPLVSRVYSVTDYQLPHMLNSGISLATGQYLTFLTPGSFYLFDDALMLIAKTCESAQMPELIYAGSIKRQAELQPTIVEFPLELSLLQKGIESATLAACFCRSDLFDTIGKFKPNYLVRCGFDFICRFAETKNVGSHLVNRLLVDFDYGPFSYGRAFRYIYETWLILQRHFGLARATLWLLTLPRPQLLKGLWVVLKQRLFS